ncbi:hypothetical protein [Glycomyces sp. NPDC048151]|uniref:hypothetical protein n=1 Tax=Glycomyces sp. NPDC048151 TaxID=3364002 RepID=UPI00371D9FB1
MANKDPYTTPRAVRIPDDEWQALDAVARAHATNRTAAIRALIRWYVGAPGATLPARIETRVGA